MIDRRLVYKTGRAIVTGWSRVRPWALDLLIVVLAVVALFENAYAVAIGWPDSLPLAIQILLGLPLGLLLYFGGIGMFAFPVLLVLAWWMPGALRTRHIRRARRAGVMLLMGVLVLYSMKHIRQVAFTQATMRAAPLLQAIRDYAQVAGRPPATLTALVPHFLVTMPSTGMNNCQSYTYTFFEEAKRIMVWYDLGPAPEEQLGLPEERAAIDVPVAHALLILMLNEKEVVTQVITDAPPEPPTPMAFTTARWHDDRPGRWRLVADLRTRIGLAGQTYAQLEAWLGRPDGRLVLRDTPWEVRVVCPAFPVLLKRAHLLYWPTGAYPSLMASAWVVRLGDWAYYVGE